MLYYLYGTLILGLVYIRYPRLNSVVPYNDDDVYAINGCLFLLVISGHAQVFFASIKRISFANLSVYYKILYSIYSLYRYFSICLER